MKRKILNFFVVQTSKYFWGLFWIAATYLIFGRVGLMFDAVSGFASLVWVPTGVSIAILYIFGIRFAPAVFLGAFLTNWTVGAPISAAIGIATGNMLEAVIGVKLLRALNFDPLLTKARDVIILFIPSVFFSTLISAIIGVTTLSLVGIVSPSSYFNTWIAWWVGDLMGALVFAPVIMMWLATPVREEVKKFLASIYRQIEIMAAFLLLLFMNFAIFFAISGSLWTNRTFLYLIFIPLTWISLRFNQRGSVTAIFLTSIIAIWGTISGSGPFMDLSINQGLIALQLFMGTASLTMMIMAATVSERTIALETLKREDKRLAIEKARTDAAFLSIGEGIVVTDTEGRIVMVNKAFEDMLGWKSSEVIGETFVDVVPKENEEGDRIPKEERNIPRILQGQKPYLLQSSQNHYLVRKDGTRFPVSMITNTISTEHLEGAVEAFRDITREKEIDKAKTEFVSLASHQLRTPATNMKWFLEMLLTGEVGELNEKQKEYFEEVHKNNLRMIVLINTILNVSRMELGVFEVMPNPTDITKVIKGVLEEHKSLIEKKNLNIKESYDNVTPILFIDAKLMRIVLHNLVSNAVKYTKAGGSVSVEVGIKNKGEEVDEHTMQKDSVVITVADTGYGIPKDQRDKIFSRLFRADNVRKKDTDGTGLGLYLAKMILDQTGGDLWFTSEVDKGTTFHLGIPVEGMKKRKGTKELTIA